MAERVGNLVGKAVGEGEAAEFAVGGKDDIFGQARPGLVLDGALG